ncbi:ABC transporter, phosphonate, periplasmic substrate-binding protein [Phycisphaerae bacterium RAS1]|nr:ABC transporter, phosphonate, periplasmic substrate-binding protein [Phycisphaerae bacterium RAS1]
MPRPPASSPLVLAALLLCGSAGCRHGGLPLINLLGIDKPLVVALVTENVLEAINPFTPYEPLRAEMTRSMGRQVALDLCLPLQVETGLDNGMYHVAILSPAVYAQLPHRERYSILAVPVDERGRTGRSALLIAPLDGSVGTIADVRGKSVAFCRADCPRAHFAAIELLKRNGIEKSDLALEVFPLPGSLKHLPDSAAVIEHVRSGGSAAGFIDEDAAGDLAAAKLKEVARTTPVPDRLVVRSPKLDDATAGRVSEFLLQVGQKHAAALSELHLKGYAAPPPELTTECMKLAAPGGQAPEPK